MDWFANTFLPSFEKCKSKRISEKQYLIFEKYLSKYIYKSSQLMNAEQTEYHFNNAIIITSACHAGYGQGWIEYYLTIR